LLASLTGLRAEPFDQDYTEIINGAKLHFRVRGADPANPYLLILHGGPGFSAHMFYPWGKSIESAVNVVYLDQRGSGQSARLKLANPMEPTDAEVKDYTLENLLKDIEGVREFLKVKEWYVLGHSWGGMLGINYVSTYPARVKGFIFADGLLSQPATQEAILDFSEKQIAKDEKSADPKMQERAARLKPYLPYARGLGAGVPRLFSTMQFAMGQFNDIYYADGKVGTDYNAKVRDALTAYHIPLTAITPANEPAAALIKTAGYATRDDSARLAKIKCRTLVLNGRQDGLITTAAAQKVHAGIVGSEILLLDQCGHFPFAEQPAAFSAAILRFIAAK
jgi:pimeloyl-ACP methyl ester carboxylesterase